jgi:hypothetical protein
LSGGVRFRQSTEYRLGSSFGAVFAVGLAVSEPTAADSTATGSRDAGDGEGRDDEPTQNRPVTLEIGDAVL